MVYRIAVRCPLRYAFCLLCVFIGTIGKSDDLALIKDRLRERYLVETSRAPMTDIRAEADTLREDGSWPDLDYAQLPYKGQYGLKSFAHVERLRQLTRAWWAAESEKTRASLADKIHRALGHWLKVRPQTTHSWYMQIGVPVQIAKVALMFESELTAEERRGIVDILRTSVRSDGVLIYAGKPATGQNLIWEAGLQIVSGVLTLDPEYIAKYVARAEQEIVVTLNEGIQPDWSFHQHGPLLQSGASYGVTFSVDTSRLAAVLLGTRFAFAPKTVEVITRHVLDGQQWMVRGDTWDFGVIGRDINWPGNSAQKLSFACDEVAQLAPERGPEIAAFAARLRGRSDEMRAPEGMRAFWRSDYVVQRNPRYLVSVRMSSQRTYGNESGYGQGSQNYHLGDGVMTLLKSGAEYRDIYPLWNWRRLPGLTCLDDVDTPLPQNIWGVGSEGGSRFVGGVTDGQNGIAAMELNRGGVYARKAWFFFDRAVVCLGAGIHSEKESIPVITTVNQCWAKAAYSLASHATPISDFNSAQLSTPGWVHHDGIGYYFPETIEVNVARQKRSSNWGVINTATKNNSTVVSGDVFALWIDHSKGARRDSYAYVVLPDETLEAMPEATLNAPVVLANTPQHQVVRDAHSGVAQLVFWEAGGVRLPDDLIVSVDAPCLIQIRPLVEAHWTLSVADPNQSLLSLRVSIAKGKKATPNIFEFQLPTGGLAGQSQTRHIAL